jgi:hypothetical protein
MPAIPRPAHEELKGNRNAWCEGGIIFRHDCLAPPQPLISFIVFINQTNYDSLFKAIKQIKDAIAAKM